MAYPSKPSMSFCVLFPGQGSQRVGMGADLFEARPDLLGQAADDVLGWSLREVCLQGPEELLTSTNRAQPALFALSFALWDEFAARLDGAMPVGAAGHSLGEYTALAAAGVIGYPAALSLVAARGEAMDRAAGVEPSGMAALLGVEVDAAEKLAESARADGGRLWVANINAPGQVVVAGAAADIALLAERRGELGVRRVVPLKVAGAFHTPLMQPAVEPLREALAGVEFGQGAFPVWSDVTARPFAAGEVPALLARQVTAPVRFADILEDMAKAGATRFVHVGPGDVTASMAKRSVPAAEVLVVSSMADIEETVERLSASVR
jgi:[acyl-carrier-protein] S-malonyltransferase